MTNSWSYGSILSITILAVILLLGGCGDDKQRLQDARQEVERLAAKINDAFVTARDNTLLRKAIVEQAYENKDQYDLSIEGMDVSEGGVYKWFEEYVYYPVEDKFDGKGMITFISSESGLYIDPQLEYRPENFSKARQIEKDGPEMAAVKQDIRLWEYILTDVTEAGDDIGYTEYVYFANPRQWLQIHNFYFDYVSAYSPKVIQEILGNLEWLVNGTPYGNPEGIPLWTQDAFVAMVGEGWLETLSLPLYAHDRYIGFLNANLYPVEIAEQDFKNNNHTVLFLGSSTSLLGVSKSAKALLEVKELHDFDYLEQMKENAFVQDEFKLTHESQKPSTQEIGKKILAGEKEFEVDIKGTTYTVIVGDIPEVNFYVVGLVEK